MMLCPDQWQADGTVLTRTFSFNNFVEAVEFVNNIVPLAEQVQHHPDLEIFGYKNVRVKLSTHDAGDQITEKDVSLATQINILFG